MHPDEHETPICTTICRDRPVLHLSFFLSLSILSFFFSLSILSFTFHTFILSFPQDACAGIEQTGIQCAGQTFQSSFEIDKHIKLRSDIDPRCTSQDNHCKKGRERDKHRRKYKANEDGDFAFPLMLLLFQYIARMKIRVGVFTRNRIQ